ncbi:hypothetical protein [Almyronema epifaneia]|uniref:CsbD family protein n=1 Tax=Almyronema epifaneia S1 TaxID=2991925 RepID=A0ABW6IFI8_9CYAN
MANEQKDNKSYAEKNEERIERAVDKIEETAGKEVENKSTKESK